MVRMDSNEGSAIVTLDGGVCEIGSGAFVELEEPHSENDLV